MGLLMTNYNPDVHRSHAYQIEVSVSLYSVSYFNMMENINGFIRDFGI